MNEVSQNTRLDPFIVGGMPMVIIDPGEWRINPETVEAYRLFQEHHVVSEAPKYLVSKDTKTISDRQFEEISWDAWLREHASRNERGRGTRRGVELKGTTRLTRNDVYAAGVMGMAKGSVNDLKLSLLFSSGLHPSALGEKFFLANESDLFSDHNKDHARRGQRMLDGLFTNDDVLRNTPGVLRRIPAAYIAHEMHDRIQVLLSYLNLFERTNYDVKEIHALLGSFLPVIFEDNIRESFFVYDTSNEKEVKKVKRSSARISREALYFSELHDEQDVFVRSLNSRRRAYPEMDYYELCDLYNAGDIDRTTMSIHQRLAIAFIEKTGELPKDMENPDFSKIFPQVLVDEKVDRLMKMWRDTGPLFKSVSQKDRVALEKVAKAVNWVDTLEFIATEKSIWRKLLTQRSSKRPFLTDRYDILLCTVNRHRADQGEEIFSNDIPPQEILWYAIKNLPSGNLDGIADNDVFRSLWEFLHQNDDESDYVRVVTKDNAVMGVIAFGEIGRNLMSADTNALYEMMVRNCIYLGQKTLRKTYQHHSVPEVTQRSIGIEEGIKSIPLIFAELDKYDHDAAVLFLQKADASLVQYVQLLLNLGKKPRSVLDSQKEVNLDFWKKRNSHTEKIENPIITTYSDEKKKIFEYVVDKTIEELTKKYNLSPEDIQEYERFVLTGKLSPHLPYTTYDTLTGAEKMNTTREQDPAVWEYVKELIKKIPNNITV